MEFMTNTEYFEEYLIPMNDCIQFNQYTMCHFELRINKNSKYFRLEYFKYKPKNMILRLLI